MLLSIITVLSSFSVGINTVVSAATETSESVSDAASTKEGQWVNAYIQKGSSYLWIANNGSTSGDSTANVDYKLNGTRMYCLQPAEKGPVSSSRKCLIRFSVVGNENLRKAMYHFYMDDLDSKVRELLTSYSFKYTNDNYYLLFHYTLAYIYAGFPSNPETKADWNEGTVSYDQRNMCKSLADYIKGLSNAPDSYTCYYVQTPYDKQTLIYVSPNVVTLKKVDKTTGKALAGATLHIYSKALSVDGKTYGKVVGRGAYTTESDGTVTIKCLPPGEYYVAEDKAPKGYIKTSSTNTVSFSISATETSSTTQTVSFENNLGIHLQIIKSSSNSSLTNNNSMYSLAGAVYGIYTDKACKNLAGKITTDANGYGAYTNSSGNSGKNTAANDKGTVAYNKNAGTAFARQVTTYYCKEITAPKGFEIDSTVYQFKDSGVKASDEYKIYRAIVSDDPVNDPVGIVLQKKNAVTGETVNQGLEGAVFEVQYFAQEIDKDYDVALDDTAPTLSVSNHKRTWYIQTDEDGYCDLSSEFILNNSTYISDDFYYNSFNIVTLPIGTVVIREIEAPQGYTVSDTMFYRRITEEGAASAQDTNTPIEVPIDELPAVGYVGLHKLNNARKGVANAVYGLYETENADGTPLATLTTDKDGYGVFDYQAPIGTALYIKELTAPTGYELDETVYPVTATTENLTVDTAVIQEVYEDSIKGNLEIKKASDDGVVKNLWFAVVDDMGNEYNAVATDENGEATVVGLPVYNDGKKIEYTVKELGFKVDTTNGYYQYNGYIWEIEQYKCITYKGVAYEGVADDVYASLDDIPEYTRYYYGDRDTAVKNQNGVTKTLEDNATVTYSFENKVKTAELEVYKKSFDGQLEDFCFEIFDNYGKSHGIIKTDKNGYAKATGLKSSLTVPNSSVFIPLQYKVVELGYKNPGTSNYYLPDKYKGVVETEYLSCDPAKGKFTLTFDVYNEADIGELRIEKSSDDGDVADLWFEISAWEDWGELYETPLGYDKDGNAVYSIKVKTDKDGKASTSDVQLYDINGKKLDGVFVYVVTENDMEISYKIKELGYDNGNGTYSLPDRYQDTTESEFLYLNENRIATYTCNNVLVKGKLQIEKTSDDGIVSGFWFNIKSEYIDTDVCTNESGISDIIGDLDIYRKSVGNANELVEYTVTELGFKTYDDNDEWTGYELPERYLAPTPQTITLDTDATAISIVKFKNAVIKSSVFLEKTDAAGNGIAGVEFNLYSADDELIKLVEISDGYYEYSFADSDDKTTSLITTEDGDTCDIYIDSLPYGDYYFVEVSLPNGYLPYSEKIPFSVTKNNEEISLTCKNQKVLFDTGGFGVLPFYFCGAIALSVTFKLYYKKKKEVKQ